MPTEKKLISDFEFILPAMGEGIIEATITRWLVSKGQHVKIDQPLVEIATDKVDSEVPSPVEGIISAIYYNEGEIPKVGEVIAIIKTNDDFSNQKSRKDTIPINNINNTEIKPVITIQPKKIDPVISPLLKMLAKQQGLRVDEIKMIHGTGENGRITKEDINQYFIGGRKNSVYTDLSIKNGSLSEFQLNSGDEVVEMDRMRKLISSHMVFSKRTAPHVTSFVEADVTSVVKWREEKKNEFFDREGVKLTFTPIFAEITAKALKEFPGINISLVNESIIFRKNINIGIATALSDGNLIVPVIKNADHKNLNSLARIISDLSNRARKGSLIPDEIMGGTFTITNIGQYNNLTGTPIINQPQSAILATGTIVKKPWAVKTERGYGIAVRDIIMLSLTYDHRIINGALGGSFLNRIAFYLENFETNRDL